MKNVHELRFLVIDDDAQTVERIVSDLKGLGFTGKIYTAFDGDQGLDVLKSKLSGDKIEFIICDMVMPKKSGIEFLKDIKEKGSPFINIPVLMLTSQSEKSLIVSCIKLGIDQYLLKPWNQKALMMKIIHVFENKEQGSPI